MNTHDPALAAIAASLDVSHVHELAQLNEEAFWNYARTLAGGASATREHSAEQEEYLECVSEKGRFLLSLTGLYEIVPSPRHYTVLPGNPVWVSGLAAWRGTAIVVVDLTMYLTGEMNSMQEQLPPQSLLIAHAGDVSLGLLVHSNGNILPADGILPVPFVVPDEVPTVAILWYVPALQTVIAGIYADAIVLDIPALLTDIVRQIEIAATYG
ncbi:MAG: chemotaxis protein CheW [Ktedonobacteraceae bacterium]